MGEFIGRGKKHLVGMIGRDLTSPLFLIRFLMDIMRERELATKMDIIFVVGCAELSPSGRGRLLKFAFSNGAYWNNKELMYNAKLILSVLQILKLLKYGHFENGGREGNHILVLFIGETLWKKKNYLTSINEPFFHLLYKFWESCQWEVCEKNSS